MDQFVKTTIWNMDVKQSINKEKLKQHAMARCLMNSFSVARSHVLMDERIYVG
jgi:hypothetical protein